MDTHLEKPPEIKYLPPDSVDFQQIPVGNSPTPVFSETCHNEGLDIESPQDKENQENASMTAAINMNSLSEDLKKPDLMSPVLPDKRPHLVGAGLANLGNTCFLNAVMQCFTHSVTLIQGLRSYNHAMSCDGNTNGFCVFCAFREHIEISLASTGSIISPWKFVDNLSYFSSSFQRYQQEDAHEFLQFFLDRLDSSCGDSKTKLMTMASQDDNFVKQCFGGRLVSRLKCCQCDHFSDTYEPSIDLSLEIEDVDTLETALASFTKVEKIEDPETKFTCESCKEEVSIEKQLILEQAPSVAVFHLKRFKNNGSSVEKIDKSVKLPLKLDLLPYTTSSQNSTVELKYDLYAVLVHIGLSSTSGHYYCFIRSSPNTWYKFDDSKVVRVQEDYVLSQEAYVVFYAKQGTTWFSSYLETLKPFLAPPNTSPKSVLENVETCASLPNTTTYDHDVNSTSEAADAVFMEFTDGSRHDQVYNSEHKDETQRMSCSNSSERTNNVEKVFMPYVLQEKNLNQDVGKSDDNINNPQTPPRSFSPDIYNNGSPEVVFSIHRNHLKMVNKLSCKKQLKKDWEGSETKEARRLLKSMPNTRGRMLLAAMETPLSEGYQNKKQRRMESSPHKDNTPSKTHRKAGLQSVARPLAAGFFR